MRVNTLATVVNQLCERTGISGYITNHSLFSFHNYQTSLHTVFVCISSHT